DDPGVDLRFRNTTGDWIRLDAWTDGANIGFTIVGVDPGWEVEATTPRIYDRIRTIETPVRQVDWSLPPGREIWVEHAEDGFGVTFDRLVKLGDEVVDERRFASRYQPSRNVILVGVSAAPAPPPEPTAAPVPPPEPTAAPAPAPEPVPAIPPPAAPPATKAGAEAARRLESAGTGIPGLRPAAPRKR
ncbi:MAG TPA: hypothetical protein VGL23_20140, partial [Chloroflexota bacterium]